MSNLQNWFSNASKKFGDWLYADTDERMRKEKEEHQMKIAECGNSPAAQSIREKFWREDGYRLQRGIARAKQSGNEDVIEYALELWDEFALEHPVIAAEVQAIPFPTLDEPQTNPEIEHNAPSFG